MAAPSILECVATVAAEERKRAQAAGADAELIDIAYWSRVSQGAVSRFENHHSQPRELDRLVLAYAKVCGIPAGDILREAVARWEEAGSGATPAEAFAEAAEEIARTRAQRPAPGRAQGARRRGSSGP